MNFKKLTKKSNEELAWDLTCALIASIPAVEDDHPYLWNGEIDADKVDGLYVKTLNRLKLGPPKGLG